MSLTRLYNVFHQSSVPGMISRFFVKCGSCVECFLAVCAWGLIDGSQGLAKFCYFKHYKLLTYQPYNSVRRGCFAMSVYA